MMNGKLKEYTAPQMDVVTTASQSLLMLSGTLDDGVPSGPAQVHEFDDFEDLQKFL